MGLFDRIFGRGGDEDNTRQPQDLKELLEQLTSEGRGGVRMFVSGPGGMRPVTSEDDLASILMGGGARGRSYEGSPFSEFFGSGMDMDPDLGDLFGMNAINAGHGEDDETMELLTSDAEPEIDIDEVLPREAGQRVLLEEKLAAARTRISGLQEVGLRLANDKQVLQLQVASEKAAHSRCHMAQVNDQREQRERIDGLQNGISKAQSDRRRYRRFSNNTDYALEMLIGELTSGTELSTEDLVERLERARDIYHDGVAQLEFEARQETMGALAGNPPKPRAEVRAEERKRAAEVSAVDPNASATETDPPEQAVNTAETVVSNAAGAGNS